MKIVLRGILIVFTLVALAACIHACTPEDSIDATDEVYDQYADE